MKIKKRDAEFSAKMSFINDLERKLVNDLVGLIRKVTYANDNNIVIKIDRDSPARVFTSDFDFLIAKSGHVIFFEAKRVKRLGEAQNTEKIYGMLSDTQKLFGLNCSLSFNPYFIIVFCLGQILIYELNTFNGVPNFRLHEHCKSMIDAAEFIAELF